MIANGGVLFTLKAHAVCGECTEYADLSSDIQVDRIEFMVDAEKRFMKAGWKFKPGYKAQCPTCAARKRPKKETKVSDGKANV